MGTGRGSATEAVRSRRMYDRHIPGAISRQTAIPQGIDTTLTAGRHLRLRVAHEMQPAIAAIDRPAWRLIATQQALLEELVLRARTVELMSAMDDGAQHMAGLPAKPSHSLLERGPHLHSFGNQRHRGRPEVVIERSHHDLRCSHSNGDAGSPWNACCSPKMTELK